MKTKDPNSNDSNSSAAHELPDWQRRLQERGILEAALAAGVHPYEWCARGRKTPGWAFPLFDEHGQPYILSDGRSAQRWKNFDSTGKPKYRFGYPNSPKGQAKPAGCDIYFSRIDILAEVAAAGGLLYITCGEPDTWTLMAVGIRNAISFFGETLIPANLPDRAKRWGVREFRYLADRDDTGREGAEKFAAIMALTGIDFTVYALPETVNDQPIKDINDLYRALDCDPERFRQALAALPVALAGTSQTTPPGPAQTGTTGEAPSHERPAGSTDRRDLPERFYQAIEEGLGVHDYGSDGWSKPVTCPFHHHEYDDRRPAAGWQRDKHILYCFKCGESWNAIETGEALGLDWHDYCDRQRPRQKAGSTTGSHAEPPEPTVAPEPNDAQRQPVPTDDEVGAQLLSTWDGNYAYFWDRWYHYQRGLWMQEPNIDKPIWDGMIAAKALGYRPTEPKRKSVEAYLRAQRRIPDDQIDAQDHLINLQNGVYNLETGLLEPHRREHYLTSQLRFAYDPAADCPLWLRCLDQWLTMPDGEPDPALQALVQEGFGYTLTTDTSYETAFMLYGAAGSGKSQLIGVLQCLLGDAHVSLDLNNLDRNPYQLVGIAGKRLITCTEAASKSSLSDAVFKQLVSGEEMVLRPIYGKPFQYQSRAKIWWAGNERPHNRDRSNAVYRRLKIIPFHRAISPEQQDRQLAAKLEQELPGIFGWALEGWARLRQQGGFTPVAQVEEQVQEYKAQNDTEAACLDDEEWFSRKPEAEIKASDLYIAYFAWCERNGHHAENSTRISEHWKRLGLVRVRHNNANYYRGVTLTPMAAAIVQARRR